MPLRPCWVEVRIQALEDNLRFLAQLATPHAELLAVVKADAYGHGLTICAPAGVRAGVRWLGVTSVEEGVAARAVCADAFILIMSGVSFGQGAALLQNNLTAAVWEPWHCDELEDAARAIGASPRTVPVHLEIETGMSRQGADAGHLSQLLSRFHAESPLKLDGIMTHLFAADEANGMVTHDQLARLAATLEQVKAAGLHAEWLNVGNSAALLSGQAAAIGEMAARHEMRALLRPGLALYGLAPRFDPDFDHDKPATLVEACKRLKPALSWKTKVVSVRSIPAGAAIGYNGTFVATEPMRLALIAAGYADGLDRKLGNHFSLLVRGQRAPLVGRVSMDQAVIDVTEISDVAVGDEVVILGSQGNEMITAFDHAEAAGTIPWDVFTRIGSRVARIAV